MNILKMKRWVLLLVFSVGFSNLTMAQQNELETIDLGFEIRAFQRGWSPSLDIEYPLDVNGNHNILGNISMFDVNYSEFGYHLEEKGKGYGVGLAYRYYINDFAKGFFAGIRADYWWTEFNYTDEVVVDEEVMRVSGTSDVQLFMPSVEMGYKFIVDNAQMYLRPSISYGIMNNVKVVGSEVGEDNYLFIGLATGFRL